MNPTTRDYAEKLAQYRIEQKVSADPNGYSIGRHIGTVIKCFDEQYQRPAAGTHTERRRIKAIHDSHLRQSWARVLAMLILYAHDNEVVISIEQATSYATGVQDEFVHELMGEFLENLGAVWKQIPKKGKDDISVFHRVRAQRMFNTAFAMIANSNLGDPIIDVLDPYVKELNIRL